MTSTEPVPSATPRLRVGILTAPRVEVALVEGFGEPKTLTFSADTLAAPQRFAPQPGVASRFEVRGVAIGIGFHWEQTETQAFAGALEIVPDGKGNVVAVNDIDIESYLRSVISSEMSATSSPELLKAHAVISRGWVLSQISHRESSSAAPDDEGEEIVRWYDRSDHDLYDVCADDHCQRYQGLGRQTTAAVARAVADTRGLALTYHGRLCDARFSKCCGGVTEEFGACWQEEEEHPYLAAVTDTPDSRRADLRDEAAATRFILKDDGAADAFCRCSDPEVISQILNDYDRADASFYRWEEHTDGARLGDIIRRKAGIDLGDITSLRPLSRGRSGRITRLEVTGTRGRRIIGKELEIRRWLSTSHLKSSAFVVEADNAGDGPARFTLRGAGWGHGVGLCQIGAAVMASRGYTFSEILSHYYPGAELTRLYE